MQDNLPAWNPTPTCDVQYSPLLGPLATPQIQEWPLSRSGIQINLHTMPTVRARLLHYQHPTPCPGGGRFLSHMTLMFWQYVYHCQCLDQAHLQC